MSFVVWVDIVSRLLLISYSFLFFFFFNDTATTEIYTLSLHDALPICDLLEDVVHLRGRARIESLAPRHAGQLVQDPRSEEHTSELQSHHDLVCRLLLEKKKKHKQKKEIKFKLTRQRISINDRLQRDLL